MAESEFALDLPMEEPEPIAQSTNGHHADGHHPTNAANPGVRRPRWSGYTAFVLSGGTARGALQVGALRALLEHGERPDVIVGTSIGAWNGALLAHDPSLSTLDELAAIKGIKPQIAAITARAMNGEIEFEAALRERVALLKDLPQAALEEAGVALERPLDARDLDQVDAYSQGDEL